MIVTGKTSDGYHTFDELYEFRMLYNAAFFNELENRAGEGSRETIKVVKSKRHHDGDECFSGSWFIVVADLPSGQISNHYPIKDWDFFKIPEVENAPEWDGHTSQDVMIRLRTFLKGEV